MDPNRFDTFTRSLGAARTRRGMMKMLGAAALGAIGLTGGTRGAGAAPASKVGICHRTNDPANPYVYITVSQNAVDAHKAHGDVIDPDFKNDPDNCGECGVVCGSGSCQDGVCADSDPCLQEGLTNCNSQCIDTQNDANNCGECDKVCDAPDNATATCKEGGCVVTCNEEGHFLANDGSCMAMNTTCDRTVLSSTADGSQALHVDDYFGWQVHPLGSNVRPLMRGDGIFGPVNLGRIAEGDTIEVWAQNNDGHVSLSPLYLVCPATGQSQTLDPVGVPDDGHDHGWSEWFYHNVFTAAF